MAYAQDQVRIIICSSFLQRYFVSISQRLEEAAAKRKEFLDNHCHLSLIVSSVDFATSP
jgi:hypothetical protein